MRDRLPPHLMRERTRHGRIVYYVRRDRGARIRLRAEYDTAEFWAEYRAALEGVSPKAVGKAKPQTLRWAIDLYRHSSDWAQLAPATRKGRENVLINVIKTAGDTPLADITTEAIEAGRDRRVDRPGAANNFLKALRPLFAWLVAKRVVSVDPTKGVKPLKKASDEGFHTWTEVEIARFEARWPVGTRERLAFDVFLYTGLRRGDACKLGRQHVRDGVISIRTEKTGETVTIPILPPLAASISAAKTGDLTYLVTEYGRPFNKFGFGNWFRVTCRQAGCPGSAHGLRKAAAVRVAEAGANERALMALFGWSSNRMASHYTRAADRKRLSAQTAAMLIPVRRENETSRTMEAGAGKSQKTKENQR